MMISLVFVPIIDLNVATDLFTNELTKFYCYTTGLRKTTWVEKKIED